MDAPLHHTQSAPTLATLPEDVISYIINFVEVDWRPLILFDSNTGNLRPTDVSTDTLTQLSLVHRSWTRPAQKAAGRRLVITLGGHLDSASAQLRRAIDSSLFGPWTKYAYLDCSLVDAMLSVPQSMSQLKTLNERRSCPSEVNDHDYFNKTVVELLGRLSGLDQLTLHLGWPVASLPAIFSGLLKLQGLRHLDISNKYGDDPGELFKPLSHLVAELPCLEVVSIKNVPQCSPATTSIFGCFYSYEKVAKRMNVPVRDKTTLNKKPPPMTLKEIRLYGVEDSDFVDWLFSRFGYVDDNTPSRRLERLGVTLCFPANLWESSEEIHQKIVMAMNPTRTLCSLSELTLSIQYFAPGDDVPDSVKDLLGACTSIKTLRISHSRTDLLPLILQRVPLSVTVLDYTLVEVPVAALVSVLDIFTEFVSRKVMSCGGPALNELRLVLSKSVSISSSYITNLR